MHLIEINVLRPSYEDVLEYFAKCAPDIVGLSAVVSTSYEYVKKISRDLKRILPDVIIVCGGNLVAGANVVLKRTHVDICCTGEGETSMSTLVDLWATNRLTIQNLKEIKGLAFLDENRNIYITPYADQISERDIFNVNWSLTEGAEWLATCFTSKIEHQGVFSQDSRYYQPQRRGKTFGRFYASKGCVARCTFCHRFTKGIRYVPIDLLEKRLAEFISRFNVGFIYFTDENFGTHEKWILPFLEMISRFDILWGVGGIRVNAINDGLLGRMYSAGCTSVAYGTETGSAKMLDIMEKKVALQDNYSIASMTPKANLFYAPQMVIGMPGEDDGTIEETIRFLDAVYDKDIFIHPGALQVNYAQALPGTPLYEKLRIGSPIGDSIDWEENYLLSMSDISARDIESAVNQTTSPYLVWKTWMYRIRICANYSYVRKFGSDEFLLWHQVMSGDENTSVRDGNGNTYYCNVQETIRKINSEADIPAVLVKSDQELRMTVTSTKRIIGDRFARNPIFWYRIRRLLPILLFFSELWKSKSTKSGWRVGLRHLREYLLYLLAFKSRSGDSSPKGISLRKQVNAQALRNDEITMVPLRRGR